MNDVLITRHGVEVGDLDVMASISVPHAEALAAPDPCSGGRCRAPVAPGGDRARGSVAAGQDVLDAEPEVFEEHLGSLQVDAIWVFLEQEVTSSLLEIDLVLGFDRGD